MEQINSCHIIFPYLNLGHIKYILTTHIIWPNLHNNNNNINIPLRVRRRNEGRIPNVLDCAVGTIYIGNSLGILTVPYWWLYDTIILFPGTSSNQIVLQQQQNKNRRTTICLSSILQSFNFFFFTWIIYRTYLSTNHSILLSLSHSLFDD